jgi:hypothetical protein
MDAALAAEGRFCRRCDSPHCALSLQCATLDFLPSPLAQVSFTAAATIGRPSGSAPLPATPCDDCPCGASEWYSGAFILNYQEEDVKKGIILAAGLALAGFALLAGCKSQNQYTIPVKPTWQGPPYHIAFDSQATKPNPSGVTIPDIKYTANPDAVVNRAALLVRIEPLGAEKSKRIMNQMVMGAFDIHGAQGVLPADYMDEADKSLAGLLEGYGVKGKIKVSVLLAQSSISSQPGDAEINQMRLSDWLSTDVEFKEPRRAR